MTISERIKYLISDKGYNYNSFSKVIGLTNNVTIGRIINENRTPSFEILNKILQNFKDVNANWLLTGEGSTYLNQEPGKNIAAEPSPIYNIGKLDILQYLREKDQKLDDALKEIGKLRQQLDDLKAD